MRVGYIRVSTVLQNTMRQLDGIELDKKFEDKITGRVLERPALQQMIEFVREGDVLYVHSIDRIARNLDDLKKIVKKLVGKGVSIEFMKEGLKFNSNTNDAMSNLLLNILGSFAEFEVAIMRERQREGIAIAKKDHKYKGRKPCLDESGIAELKHMLSIEGIKPTYICKKFKFSLQTLCNYRKKLSKIN